MNDYQVWYDIEIVRELLGMTMQELADELGVSRMSLNRWKEDSSRISAANLSAFYSMAFRKNIRLNKIKEQFFREDYSSDSHIILFHGAKTHIEGELSLEKSRQNNDFGKGFYCGENLEQSAMFVSNFPDSSLYIVDFLKDGLRSKRFGVNREWMLMIAFFRNRLGEFSDSVMIHELAGKLQGMDYMIAPIADNRMFEIIDSFIEGEITDIQCQHCLSATNLGNQYVLLTNKALKQTRILSHCYLAKEEKEHYLLSRRKFNGLNHDKVKVARRKYRGQGKYIEEILK